MAERVVDELSPALIVRRVKPFVPKPSPQFELVSSPPRAKRLDERTSLPFLGQVDHVVPKLDTGLIEFGCDMLHESFDACHRVVVVRVRLVPLEHRELWVVLERDTFVAEVLANLVDPFEPADDEPLEVELSGNAEVERLAELIVHCRERPCEGAAVARLQNRCLDLNESVRVQETTDRRNHPRAKNEVGARLLVHQQVEIALAVPELDVGETVEDVRERRTDPREQLEPVDGERGLAAT